MSTMNVLGDRSALCAHNASPFDDGLRRGTLGRFQKVPPPKSFPFWRLLSASCSSSRFLASSFSFAFLALAHDFWRAIVAASYGAKTWREDSNEGVGLRADLFFRPVDGTEALDPWLKPSDWLG